MILIIHELLYLSLANSGLKLCFSLLSITYYSLTNKRFSIYKKPQRTQRTQSKEVKREEIGNFISDIKVIVPFLGNLLYLGRPQDRNFRYSPQKAKMKIKRKRYKKKVKRLVYSLLVCLAFVLVNFNFSGAIAQQVTPDKYTPKHYTELEFEPVGEIKLPEYERYELENGMVVYLMENHELPLVSGRALIHTGSRFEPSNEVGLAQITGTVMRSGGTQKQPPNKLNQMLEQRAASVETNVGDTSGGAAF